MKTRQLLLSVAIIISILSCSTDNGFKKEKADLNNVAYEINKDFVNIKKRVNKLSNYIEHLYLNKEKYIKQADKSKYKFAESGIFYKPENDGGSAVYVSGLVPITEKIKNIVYFTEPLDSIFKEIIQKYPSVVQAYYNDKHSYNRMYPFIDVLTAYEPSLDIPSFNFYFLADEEHNPNRQAVWVSEPYVDPAGRGWMVSAIAPVYVKDELVGVPGLDVTINTIFEKYLIGKNSDLIIVDNKGVLVAANDLLVNLFSLPPLKDHLYIETIKSDQYRRDDYNILKSKNMKVRQLAEAILHKDKSVSEFEKYGREYSVLATDIDELSWKLIRVIKQ